MKKEFSLEEKLEAISFVFQGETARSVSDRLHLGHHILYEWLAAYKSWGIDGLRSKKKGRSKLPYEERCKIVREYQESNIPLYQLSVKYGISSSAICAHKGSVPLCLFVSCIKVFHKIEGWSIRTTMQCP